MNLKENFKQLGIYRKDKDILVIYEINRKNIICFKYQLADSTVLTNQEVNFLFKHCIIDQEKLIYVPRKTFLKYVKDFAYLGQVEEETEDRLNFCYKILIA